MTQRLGFRARHLLIGAFVLALVALVALIVGGSGGEVFQTEWRLASAPVARSLSIAVYIPGSSCHRFERVDVDESSDTVRIRAFLSTTGAPGCTADLGIRQLTVQLDAPLGDRDLEGCRTPDPRLRGVERPGPAGCREVLVR